MNLHHDLLILARALVSGEGQAGQAHLRRAVSTAYYALFHLLVYDATQRMFGAQDDRAALRSCLARAFTHSNMAKVAKDFAAAGAARKRQLGGRLRPALDGLKVQPEIGKVARNFIALQDARHTADYDLSAQVDPEWAEGMVALAEEAFAELGKVRGTLQAGVFLAGMLVFDKIRAGAGR